MSEFRSAIPNRQLAYLIVKTYGLIWACWYVYSIFPIIYLLPIFWLFIAARQCTLYELNHEAAHGKFSGSAQANKLLSLIFCIIPFFHHVEVFSFVMWRRIHALHHKYLMTEKDPNYISRKLAGEADRPYGACFIAKQMLRTALNAVPDYFKVKQDYVYPGREDYEKYKYRHLRMLLPIKGDKEYNQELLVRLLGTIFLVLIIFKFQLWWDVFLFWIVPMYTFFPALLKMFDLLDHNWWMSAESSLEDNSGSRQVPWFFRLFTSELNRFLHKEHHQCPEVIAPQIAKVRNVI